MRKINYFYIGSLAVAALLILDTIWFGLVGEVNFGKLIGTIIIANIAVVIIDLIIRDNKEEKELKKDKFVD